MIEIKKLPLERWKDFRNLRLEALQNDPLAFASSSEEEKKLPPDEWKRRIENTLFVSSHDKPIGMIVYFVNTKIKTNHIVNIFGFYVKEEFRNQGIGKKLLECVINVIQKNSTISKIKLSVNPEQKAALKLYEKSGFELVGRLKQELKVDGKFYDEVIMEKLL